MPISLDTSVNGGTTGGTQLSYSHTVGSTATFLVVGITTSAASNTLTNVTYAGSAMTGSIGPFGPGAGQSYIYWLTNPQTGANNVVLSFSATGTAYGVSASYIGAGTPIGTAAPTPADPTASLTGTITTTVNNSWVITVAGEKSTGNLTLAAGAGVTSRQINTHVAIGDSNGVISPAGTYAQTWSYTTGSTGLAMFQLSVAPINTNAALFFSYL